MNLRCGYQFVDISGKCQGNFSFKCYGNPTGTLHFFTQCSVISLVYFRSDTFNIFFCRASTLTYACQDNRVLQICDGTGNKKKVVILGTGWAGASFLRNIDTSLYDVHVVSPRNYFTFTPLLPSVTCGTVEARSIVEPIRNIVRKVCPYSSKREYAPNLQYLWL